MTTNDPPLLSEIPSCDLVARCREGDENAANELYRRYCDQLLRIVGNHLSAKYAAKFDPEDVLQTAFRTMFRRLEKGEFQFDTDEDVWKLMVTISLNKLRRQIRSLNTQQNNISLERTISEELANQLCEKPTIQEVVEFSEMLEKLFRFLTEDQRNAILLRMSGCNQIEIAERLEVSDRTVRRMWKRIQRSVTDLLQESPSSEPA